MRRFILLMLLPLFAAGIAQGQKTQVTQPTDTIDAVYGTLRSSVSLSAIQNPRWDWLPQHLTADVGVVGVNALSVRIHPDDTANYETSLTPPKVKVRVHPARPTFTLPTPRTAVYGDTLKHVLLWDTSRTNLTRADTGWQWAAPASVIDSVGTLRFSVKFTPLDAVNYQTIDTFVVVQVGKKYPAFTIPAPLTAVYRDTLKNIPLWDASRPDLTPADTGWRWAAPDSVIDSTGVLRFRAVFTPLDTAHYLIADTIALAVSVGKISVTSPTDTLDAVYGTYRRDVDLSVIQNPPLWEWAHPNETVYDVVAGTGGSLGVRQLSVRIHPSDTAYYESTISSPKVKVRIHPKRPSFALYSPITAVYGDTLKHVLLWDTSRTNLTRADTGWQWISQDSVIDSVGTLRFSVRFTPLDAVNYQTIDTAFDVQVSKKRPAFTIPPALAASYGDSVGRVALPADWYWQSPADTVGNVGQKWHRAWYLYDTAHYTPIDTALAISVGKRLVAAPTDTIEAVYNTLRRDIDLSVVQRPNPPRWDWLPGHLNIRVSHTNVIKFSVRIHPDDTANYRTVASPQISVKALPITPPLPQGLKGIRNDLLKHVALPQYWHWADSSLGLGGTAGMVNFDAYYDRPNYARNHVLQVNVIPTILPDYISVDRFYGDTVGSITPANKWTWVSPSDSVGNAGIRYHRSTYIDAGDTVTTWLRIKVLKADPTHTLPATPIAAVYGDTLKHVRIWNAVLPPLTHADTGWQWIARDSVMDSIGVFSFRAAFVPLDTANYNIINNIPFDVKVSKKRPDFTIPPSLSAPYGDTLKNVALPQSQPQSWYWQSPDDTVGNIGTRWHRAWYLYDTAHHIAIDTALAISVGLIAPIPPADTLTAVYGTQRRTIPLPYANPAWEWTTTGTVGGVGLRKLPIRVAPADRGIYQDITFQMPIRVTQARPPFNLPDSLTAVYGDTLKNIPLWDASRPNLARPDTGWQWTVRDSVMDSIGTFLFSVKFIPINANYQTIDTTVEVQVSKKYPDFTIPALTAVYGDSVKNVALPDTYWQWQRPTDTVGGIGTRWHRAWYLYDTAHHIAIDTILAIEVGKITPAFPTDTLAAVYGNTRGSVSLAGYSNPAWVWNAPTATVGNAGLRKHNIRTAPADRGIYQDVTFQMPVMVSKARPLFNLPDSLTAVYGDTLKNIPLWDTSLASRPNLTHADTGWRWITRDSVMDSIGTFLFSVRFTPDTPANYQTIDTIVEVQVGKKYPNYAIPTPLTAIYGDTVGSVALSQSQPQYWKWQRPSDTVGNAGQRQHRAWYIYDTAHHILIDTALTIVVGKRLVAAPADTIRNITYGTRRRTIPLTQYTNPAWEWTSNSAVGSVGIRSLDVRIHPSDTANYDTISAAKIKVQVIKARPPFNLYSPLTAVYGDTLKNIPLWDTSRTNLTRPDTGWQWKVRDSVIGGVGALMFGVRFIPSSTANYLTIDTFFVVQVSKKYPDYTIPTPLTAVYRDTLQNITLPQYWQWQRPADTVGNIGTRWHRAWYLYDTAHHIAIDTALAIEVGKIMPVFPADTLSAVYGSTRGSVSLAGYSNPAWVWNAPNQSVGAAGLHRHKIRIAPADTGIYVDTTFLMPVMVRKATPPYNLYSPLTAVYGDTLKNIPLWDASRTPLTHADTGWRWASPSMLTDNIGTMTFGAIFTPIDIANYEVVTMPLAVRVEKAYPVFAIPTPLTAIYGDTVGSVTLPQYWQWQSPADAVGNAGQRQHRAWYLYDTAHYIAIDTALTIEVSKTTAPALPPVQTATYGALLNSIPLPAPWTWQTPDSAVGNVGRQPHRIAVGDTANYFPVDTFIYVDVQKAVPPFNMPRNLTAVYGDALNAVPLWDASRVNLTNADTGWRWYNPATPVGIAGASYFYRAIFTPIDIANYEVIDTSVEVWVNRARPAADQPASLAAFTGDTLRILRLPPAPNGVWRWANPADTVGNKGIRTHQAIFAPTDSINYDTLMSGVTILVAQKTTIDIEKATLRGEDYYEVDSCTTNEIDIRLAPDNGVTLYYQRQLVDRPILLNVRNPDIYEVKYESVIALDGGRESRREHILKVERKYGFANIVRQKQNKVLFVNNKPTETGYRFEEVRWFRGSEEVGSGQYYYEGTSALPSTISPATPYSVRVTTSDGKEIGSCEGFATQVVSFLKIFPNPVRRSASITIEFPSSQRAAFSVEIFSLGGTLLRSYSVDPRSPQIPVEVPQGIYILKSAAMGEALFVVE